MKTRASAITIIGGVFGLINVAHAADMTGAEIKTFISGKTGYLETTAASVSGMAGKVIIYWAADGTALQKTPSGTMMHGKWQIKDNTNCIEWTEKPGTGCVRYDKTGDGVAVIDVASGKVRAKIVKTAPGNAEKLDSLNSRSRGVTLSTCEDVRPDDVVLSRRGCRLVARRSAQSGAAICRQLGCRLNGQRANTGNRSLVTQLRHGVGTGCARMRDCQGQVRLSVE